jgi:oligopeptide transport system substrate-binding protein
VRSLTGQLSVAASALLCAASLFVSSCTQIQRPVTDPFIAATQPPPRQEFRWSNGRLAKSLDPAKAAAAPETDLVRAVFEGLTELDTKTLEPRAAVAEKWVSSPDFKQWTFYLRKDARWSNGKAVTSGDFARSWKRLPLVAGQLAQRVLYQNIIGLKELPAASDAVHGPVAESHTDDLGMTQVLKAQPAQSPSATPDPGAKPTAIPAKPLGLETAGDLVLKVSLEVGDKDFPALVANPMFRPIYTDGSEFDKDPLPVGTVTNGPFTIASIGKDDISLDRSDTYWNVTNVGLEHVRLVAKESAEAALDAYKKAELDAVTNADFEPLALKLLAPYQDFRQTAHGALNFYEVNSAHAPFSDRRVREALAVSIDRDRLTDVELEGSSFPASRMLPVSEANTELTYDAAHARDLLEKAGFPQGVGFPKIRLVVNRNDTQQRIARAVARMWKQDLNLDTQIIVKEPGEMESVKLAGDFDILRRGTVLPARDEIVSLAAILGSETRNVAVLKPETPEQIRSRESKNGPADQPPPEMIATTIAWTEEDSLFELNVIPLYFPLSYSLVKPYVQGFEIDTNGSPNLAEVKIDSSWQPKSAKSEQ